MTGLVVQNNGTAADLRRFALSRQDQHTPVLVLQELSYPADQLLSYSSGIVAPAQPDHPGGSRVARVRRNPRLRSRQICVFAYPEMEVSGFCGNPLRLRH